MEGGGGQVEPSAYRIERFSRLSFYTALSPLGLGEHMSTNVSPHIDLRVFGNYFSLNHNVTRSGFRIAGNADFANVRSTVDYYPFHKPLRVSPGFLLYNGYRVRVDIKGQQNATLTLNNIDWHSDNADPLRGTGRHTLGGSGFLITAGYGRITSRSERHFSFPFEAGVAFITMNVTGQICSASGTNCQAAATIPALRMLSQHSWWRGTRISPHFTSIRSSREAWPIPSACHAGSSDRSRRNANPLPCPEDSASERLHAVLPPRQDAEFCAENDLAASLSGKEFSERALTRDVTIRTCCVVESDPFLIAPPRSAQHCGATHAPSVRRFRAGASPAVHPSALFHFLGGRSRVDSPWLQVACRHGSKAKHRTFAYVHAGRNAGSRAHPCIGAYFHRVSQQGETGIVEVMGCAAEVGVLRENCVRSEAYGCRIVDFGAIAGGHLVGADEVPWRPHARTWVEVAVRTHSRTKEPQQHRAPSVERPR